MRYLYSPLQEKFLTAVKAKTLTGFSPEEYVEIYKNPSKEEMKDHLQNGFRGVITVDGDMFLLVSLGNEKGQHYMIHSDVTKILMNQHYIPKFASVKQEAALEKFLLITVTEYGNVILANGNYTEDSIQYLVRNKALTDSYYANFKKKNPQWRLVL